MLTRRLIRPYAGSTRQQNAQQRTADLDKTDDMSPRPPGAPPIILLEGVKLKLASRAGDVEILRGIDLEVASGETVGVVGPSGSGKSTMMMIIAGLEQPTDGRVTVLGERLGGLDEDALATFRRQNVGIVFQSFHLIPTMTALENVGVPLELAGRRDAMKAAGDLLAKVGLVDRVHHYPSQLSGGEQQRVAVARAFAARPRLLLADEPTGNLDQAAGRVVIDLLFDLRAAAGTTLLLITHDPMLAVRCGRIVRLEDGRVAGDA
jgi:putative ABC transport system ATP-binding protein